MAFRGTLRTIGRYEVLGKAGDGGLARVYKCRDPASGKIVAVKVVRFTSDNDPVILKRFEREGQAANRLHHPNIVRGYSFGHEADFFYLVMEFVEGQDLGQRIKERSRLPEQESVDIVIQVAQGLHYAHQQGIIHRDVKPENILLTPEGQAKLIDLGLAKTFSEDLDLTRSHTGLGTPNYMAPEQFQDARKVDLRCDIYSLGATLYRALSGLMPFSGRGPFSILEKKVHNDLIPPRELIPTLSAQTDWAIRRAVQADPNQRQATCLEFIQNLTEKDRDSTSCWDRRGRGRVRYSSEKEVGCLFIEDRNQRACWGKVRDISASGIGLILNRPFETGTILSIGLPRAGPRPTRPVFARVVRAHEESSATWIVGCAFEQELSESDIRVLRGVPGT
jgi:serine/threonine protein kinase